MDLVPGVEGHVRKGLLCKTFPTPNQDTKMTKPHCLSNGEADTYSNDYKTKQNERSAIIRQWRYKGVLGQTRCSFPKEQC